MNHRNDDINEDVGTKSAIPLPVMYMVHDYCESDSLSDLDTCLMLLDAIADMSLRCQFTKLVPLCKELDDHRPQGSPTAVALLVRMEREGYLKKVDAREESDFATDEVGYCITELGYNLIRP